jgi:4-amino-4-deoxy-L-arabinose transferase-like glycosyltransferase
MLLSLVAALPFAVAFRGISPDGVLYNDIAEHLLHGQGFDQDVRDTSIIVPPLYPLLLAGVYGLFGIGSVVAVLVVQSVLLSLSAGLCFLIGRRLFCRSVGAIAGTLFAIYSLAICWNGYVLTETLYVVLTLWFIWEVCRFLKERPTNRDAIVVGLVWGLGCLARPHLLFFGPLLALWLAWSHRGRGLKLALVSVGAMAATIAPWVIYLLLHYGMFIPIASHGAKSLWLGNNPYQEILSDVDLAQSLRTPTAAPAFQEEYGRILALPFEDSGAAYQREALQFIIENPLRFLGNTFQKAVFLWKGLRPHEQVLSLLGQYTKNFWLLSPVYGLVQLADCIYLALFPLGLIVSFFRNFKQHHIILWLLLYLTAFTSIGIVAWGGRYRLPMMPFVVIYASLAIYVPLMAGRRLWKRVVDTK